MNNKTQTRSPGAGPTLDLTSGPVSATIRKVAVPASLGYIFHTVYNVTDTYFGGLISSQALAALSLGFPVFFLVVSVASGLQTGAAALIGNALGEGDRDRASDLAAQTVSLAAVMAVVMAFVGRAASPWLFRLLGAEGDYLDLALAYMIPIMTCSAVFLATHGFNSVLLAAGDTKSFRNTLIFGAVINIGLDPWFMFGGFGIPAMGLAGVAWATLLIQAVNAVYLGWKACRTGLLSFARSGRFIPRPAMFSALIGQSLPAGLSTFTVCLGIFVITYFISRFGQAGVAAYGVAVRIEQIILLPTIGLNTATLTIVARCNGAGAFSRIRETVRLAQRYGVLMMIGGGVVLLTLGRPLMNAFTTDSQVIQAGSNYLLLAAFTLASYVILYVNVSALQGVKKPAFALWIGLYRQVAAPVVAFYVLAFGLDLGLWGVWWGISIVTWSAAVYTLVFARRALARLPEDRTTG